MPSLQDQTSLCYCGKPALLGIVRNSDHEEHREIRQTFIDSLGTWHECNWVKTEIYKAHEREIRGNRRILFPVGLATYDQIQGWECFDADTGKDLAREISEYVIPEFSTCKDHDSYRKAFDRLFWNLKTDAKTAGA
jgi:hypothetical protein